MKTAQRVSSIETLEPRIAPAVAAGLNLAHLNGSNGFEISGVGFGYGGGGSVSDAGDMNGDGFADLIVAGSQDVPAAYVIFGKVKGFPRNLNVATLNGSNGFKITAAPLSGLAGVSNVSGAGDFNADGFDDVIVQGGVFGSAYVIFGRASFPAGFKVANLNGQNGFALTNFSASGPVYRARAM